MTTEIKVAQNESSGICPQCGCQEASGITIENYHNGIQDDQYYYSVSCPACGFFVDGYKERQPNMVQL